MTSIMQILMRYVLAWLGAAGIMNVYFCRYTLINGKFKANVHPSLTKNVMRNTTRLDMKGHDET